MKSSSKVLASKDIKQPDIFAYVDFREFVRDQYEFLASQDPELSHRKFSKNAGFKSPSILKSILTGRRSLSAEGILKIAKGLKLGPNEAKFFERLVQLSQAQWQTEREEVFKQIESEKSFLKRRPLALSQKHYLERWYYAAIRELIRAGMTEREKIENLELFKISKKQIIEAIEDMKRIGILSENGEHFEVGGENLEIAEPEFRDSLKVFYKNLYDLSSHALDDLEREKRSVAASTFAIDAAAFPKMAEEFNLFLNFLLRKYETQGVKSQSSSAVHVSLGAFQLSK